MKQRVILAMALITRPEIVILDEPTSALDILTQASIMNVLKKISKELSISFILITHDLCIASEIAQKNSRNVCRSAGGANYSSGLFYQTPPSLCC